MIKTTVLFISLSLLLTPAALSQSPHGPRSGYVPHRVFDSREKRFSDFEAMAADLARSEVVFVGEQHNDAPGHRIELAILEGIRRRRSNVAVAMEMFERDVQPKLDDYLAGRITEEDFLKASRPWPNYAADYRPLVEFSRLQNWRVIASNAPQRVSSAVAKSGLASIDSLPPNERALIARKIECPLDDYFKRFAEAMKSHPTGNQSQSDKAAGVERFYQAQCVKDDTMGESVAAIVTTEPRPLAVHFNGAFHTDYFMGAAARAKSRLPRARIVVVSIVPVEDLDNLKADDYRRRADYVIFTLKAQKQEAGKP
jgi:uncharacterized iron-regulated protein